MNVVVFCSDTFRYDHLGFLKRHHVLTPNLDRLARESASFDNFRLCSFPTILNRMDVFSGRYTFPLLGWGPLPYQFPVLAEVFKHHGFNTALIADNPHLMKEHFGFGRGFDFVKDVPGQMDDHFQPASTPAIELPCPAEKLEPRPNRLERYRRNAWWYRQQGTNTTETLGREALRWLESPPSNFFLWIDAFDPHEPWEAPQRYREPYPWDNQGDAVIWPRDGRANQYPPADIANMRSLYKAEIGQIDYWLGELLEQLRRHKLLDDTALIFCSDHGYYFGEHGLLGKLSKRGMEKPTTIYDEVGHLPLLIRHPKGFGAGQTIHGLCQPPDLFATVTELAGIPRSPWVQGSSLVPRMQGQQGQQNFAVGGCHPHTGKLACLTVWTDQWSLIYNPHEGLIGSELYHLRSDPEQMKNVIGDNEGVAGKHFELLGSWLHALEVPEARCQQLLHASPFGWRSQVKHHLWRLGNRWSYLRNYRNYATH